MMNSDVAMGEATAARVSGDGALSLFTAPVEGSVELWRVAIDGRGGRSG